MPKPAGTLEVIGREIGQPLRQLEGLLHPEQVFETLAHFGVSFPPELLQHAGFENARKSVSDAARGISPLMADLGAAIDSGDAVGIAAEGLKLLNQIGQVIASFDSLRDAIQAAQPTLPGVTPQQVDDLTNDFPRKLLDLLLVNQLDTVPAVGATLTVLGLLDREFHDGDPVDPTKPDFEIVRLRYERLGSLLSSPADHLKNLYGWDNAGFDGETLLQVLQSVVAAMGLPSRYVPPAGPTPAKLEAFAIDVTVDKSISPPGLLIDMEMPMAANVERTVDLPHPAWKLKLTGEIELDIGATMRVAPPLEVSIEPPQDTLEGQVEVQLEGSPQSPFILIGQANGSRLEVGQISAGALLRLEWDSSSGRATLIAGVSGGLKNGMLLVDTSNGDGFIETLLGGFKLESNFDVGLAWNMKDGVQFQGSATLEISIPTHVSLGPVDIQALYIIGKLGPLPLAVELAADIKAELGPLTAVVSRIGAGIDISFPNEGGNAGPVDLDFRFKPPNGVGLSLDVGVVKGGGYLFFDFDREEYAGALELVFAEWIALKAIGLISTRLPDGSEGFSLLIIITVEFGTGIQLGYGFTLLGVGGIFGLNRIVKIETLSEGVRTGAIESVMFPQDVIANAPRIISDLRRFFPPQRDIFLVGPMAKIGWSTPTLVSVQLGVILEFPSVNITILGVIKVVLPHEDADILRLQVNFIGRIEPSNKLLWFYAELFDSRVLFITLEGGFGLLVNWGDNANFVVSAGGFHPRYNPPPLPFPEPPRIAIALLNESYAKVRIEAYFAVTSNSVQFGARVELFFGISAFAIEGHLAFDALFQFDPFFFSFGLSISLSVKVFGIGLFSVGFSGLLEGPTPWFIQGKGEISLLFFSIKVPFEHTWGESQDTTLDPIAVYPLLEAEFAALTNWRAVVPDNSRLLVALRQLGDTDADDLVLHPVGRLLISQRKVPVNFRLDKVGSQTPADYDRIVVDATLSGGGLLSVSKVEEQFAIGQFKDLDGSSKMSAPGFEPLESGIAIGMPGEQMKTSRGVRRVIRYETIIIDSNFKRHVKRFFAFFAAGYAVLNDFLFTHFLAGNSASHSALSKHQHERMQPFSEVITVQPHQYSVVFNTDNRPMDAAATTFSSQAAASQYMEQQISAHAALTKQVHVVPNTEVNIGA